MTADEHWRKAEELRAGAMRVVCGDGSVCDFGQSRRFVSGLRREGQYLRVATGASVSSMRGQRAPGRNSPVPVMRGDGLVVGGLRMTAVAATIISYLLKIF